MAEKLGSALLELRTDAKGYTKGIKDAERQAQGLEKTFKSTSLAALGIGTAIAAMAAGAAAGLLAITKSVANLGDQLNDASKITGIAVEQLSFMKAVAERSGATFSDVTTSLKFLNKNFSDLASGADKGIGPLQALGITAEQFEAAGNDVNKLLPLVIERLGGMADGADKVKIATELLGRSGTNLIPTLNAMAEGGEELRKKYEALGEILSTEVAEASDEFNDSLRDVQGAIEGVKILIGSELLPVFTDLFADLAEWISKNRELIKEDVKGFVEGIKVAIIGLKDVTGGLIADLRDIRDIVAGINLVLAPFNQHLININSNLPVFGTALKEAKNVGIDLLTTLNPIAVQLGFISRITGLDKNWEKGVENLRQLGSQSRQDTEAFLDFANATKQVEETVNDVTETTSNYIPELDKLIGGTDKQTEAMKELKKAAEEQLRIDEQALDQVKSLTEQWTEAADTFGMTAAEERKYTLETIAANAASLGLSQEGLAAVKKALEEAAGAMSQLNFKEAVRQAVEFADELGAGIADSLEKGVDAGKEAIDSLDDFIGDVAANISDTVADMLTAAFTGNFDDIMRSWKDMLKNMLNIFFQFIAAVITNPIRVALEGVLGGGSGGGILGGIGGLLGGIGESFRSLGSLMLGEFAGFAGFAGTLAAALPAIGIAAAAVFGAISLISSLMKKTPRLDIDFDSVKTEIGRRAATIGELLDEDFFKDAIAQISVKRKAGLGVGGDDAIKDLIFDRITDSIEAIQAIIAKLPQELFAKLNETLLSAELDIDTVIGGERLLEFDAKGKKIAEKFQAFIEGELPAKVFASIRESFFLPAFESLGVAGDKAQEIIDKFLADMQAAGSREERAQIGAEFLELFNAYVDVFNVINNGVQGVFEKAISDIRAMSASLDIETANGIPSLDQIQTALEDLFETGELTAETAQKFLALRQAIIDLTLALAQSISSIASTIAQLNTDIVALGGSAIDIGDGIREAIDRLQGMLDNEALSLDEREAILNELNTLTNQLAASELAKQQAAAQAAIDAQRNAINNQIQGLQKLKTIEAKKNQEALDALNKQLSVVQDLESLVDSIRANIQDLLFAPGGPESVFERISRAQAEVSRLFSALGSAGPEERAEIGRQLQDMLNELNTLRQEGFQSPSIESDALFREIVGGLETLGMMVEPARSSEAIQESIEAIQEKSQKILENIDKKIESAQAKLSGLQSVTNQLTGRVADEILALKEAIREEFIKILEERLDQLEEVTGEGFTTEIEGLENLALTASDQLVELRSHTESLDNIEMFMGKMQGFQHGTGGIEDFGRGMMAVLHGREAVVTEDQLRQMRGRGNVSVSLNLPPISFAPGQVVSPDMFMKELMTKLHDRRVADQIVKISRGRT